MQLDPCVRGKAHQRLDNYVQMHCAGEQLSGRDSNPDEVRTGSRTNCDGTLGAKCPYKGCSFDKQAALNPDWVAMSN